MRRADSLARLTFLTQEVDKAEKRRREAVVESYEIYEVGYWTGYSHALADLQQKAEQEWKALSP